MLTSWRVGIGHWLGMGWEERGGFIMCSVMIVVKFEIWEGVICLTGKNGEGWIG